MYTIHSVCQERWQVICPNMGILFKWLYLFQFSCILVWIIIFRWSEPLLDGLCIWSVSHPDRRGSLTCFIFWHAAHSCSFGSLRLCPNWAALFDWWCGDGSTDAVSNEFSLIQQSEPHQNVLHEFPPNLLREISESALEDSAWHDRADVKRSHCVTLLGRMKHASRVNLF